VSWALPPLGIGDPAPGFRAPTPSNPNFHFTTAAGRYLLLAFLPPDPARVAQALAAFEPHRARFDDRSLAAFFVATDPETIAAAQDRIPGQRWFLDRDGEVSRLYHAEAPYWLLLDPTLRVLDRAPLEEAETFLARVAGRPPPAEHAGVPLVAPVAIVPRVFEPALCEKLIALYDETGGGVSGVMREIGGKTVGVLDPMKRRRDVVVQDAALRKAIAQRLGMRLLPEIERVFQFRATRLERYLVACYDAAEGGWFHPHRDNETKGTAHRRFAVSINLNAEDYEGGDLRFPEFGPRTYRPPTGGAVVFSCSLLHEATAVTKGRRYAFLPFLYDDEGERIRKENAAFLDQGPALVLDAR
jgi:predicted 2-oxoglutarate/Fe(II)-dependent dioxygenase YbiX